MVKKKKGSMLRENWSPIFRSLVVAFTVWLVGNYTISFEWKVTQIILCGIWFETIRWNSEK